MYKLFQISKTCYVDFKELGTEVNLESRVIDGSKSLKFKMKRKIVSVRKIPPFISLKFLLPSKPGFVISLRNKNDRGKRLKITQIN